MFDDMIAIRFCWQQYMQIYFNFKIQNLIEIVTICKYISIKTVQCSNNIAIRCILCNEHTKLLAVTISNVKSHVLSIHNKRWI